MYAATLTGGLISGYLIFISSNVFLRRVASAKSDLR